MLVLVTTLNGKWNSVIRYGVSNGKFYGEMEIYSFFDRRMIAVNLE